MILFEYVFNSSKWRMFNDLKDLLGWTPEYRPNINLIMLLLYNSLVKNTNCWNAVVFERDVFFAWKVSVFGVCWSVFNPNPGKCGPEKFQIRTLFTQWRISSLLKVKLSFFGCKVPIRVFGWSNYWFLASKTSK